MFNEISAKQVEAITGGAERPANEIRPSPAASLIEALGALSR
jgi:hypothetical protein